MKRLALLFVVVACGGASRPPLANQAPPRKVSHARPQSLDEALRQKGMQPIALHAVSRTMSFDFPDKPTVRGGKISLVEEAGWNGAPSQFARAEDGRIVLVIPQPNTIVDRKVDRGCMHFAGGRGWFEQVTYQLPAGVEFGGVVNVAYDHHIEQSVYSQSPDCPPPAID